MNTLIIHPKDDSTSFLNSIYDSIIEKKVITGGITKKELINEIENHDRIMMMGHGSPMGLFNMGLFIDSGGYVIDNSLVSILSEKKNSVYIWCNSDKFVNSHKLKGFYSGMFISEVGEAHFCGLPSIKQNIVDESNYGFSKILSEVINEDQETIYEHVLNHYGEMAKHNPVASYNHKRLYLSK
jgi:hypothetical protein